MKPKNVDYIIVGLGLAGMSFCNLLEQHEKSFLVFENDSQNASLVASGMYNPIVLKRFTPVFKSAEQLAVALPFYKKLSEKFRRQFDVKVPIYRVFKSVEEQNNWLVASDHKLMSNYMISEILNKKIKGVIGNYGFGILKNTGRILSKELIQTYRNYLENKKQLIYQKFNYKQVQFNSNNIIYDNINASKIVFCEGFGLQQNPVFNYLPLNEAKGELLTIYAPKLNIDFMIKSAVFVLPLGNDLYKVGATFNWKDKTLQNTIEGKNELLEKLTKTINTPFSVLNQSAGIRPTVKDRRPLTGKHPKYDSAYILNGLGTRGVMIAPWAANKLYEYIEHQSALPSEIDIKRYAHFYQN
ncbi:MAG: NAD(P)/FAD-dependent oxidoreductase [Lutibacter sp.]